MPSAEGEGKDNRHKLANGERTQPDFARADFSGIVGQADGGKMNAPSDNKRCPYCGSRPIQTIATLPFVRGQGKDGGTQFKTMTIAGCKACVRKQLVFESLRSGVDGWGSIGAALANPVLVAYGLARAGIVRDEPERVTRLMEAAGISEPPVLPVRIAYGLAAALICADGSIDNQEIDTAVSIGQQVFSEFDRDEFLGVVAAHRDLPGPADLAQVLRGIVDARTKEAVYRFLVAVASADNQVVPEERSMLRAVADNFGIGEAGAGVDQSV